MVVDAPASGTRISGWSPMLAVQYLGNEIEQVLLAGGDDVVYLKDGKPIAFDCVGTMKDYVQARKLLESGAGKIDPALLADPEVAIKDLM